MHIATYHILGHRSVGLSGRFYSRSYQLAFPTILASTARQACSSQTPQGLQCSSTETHGEHGIIYLRPPIDVVALNFTCGEHGIIGIEWAEG